MISFGSKVVSSLRFKILLLDDDASILSVLKRILEKKDFNTVTFQNPNEALEYLKENPVDLIITDLHMPGMDGLQFFSSLRHMIRGTPVLFVTGGATISTAVAAIQLGAYDYIRKPFEIKKIYELVDRALSVARR